MAVLIVGAGLIGSQIARILVEKGEQPVIFDVAPQRESLADIVELAKVKLVQGDVKSPWELSQVFRDHAIDEVVHTAANPMLTSGAQQRPYASIELNIMGTTNVLEAARSFGVKRIAVSSSNVLAVSLEGGEDKGDPAKEEAFPRPNTFYAATKQAVEGIALNYARWLKLDVRAVRYAAVAGPWRGAGGGGPTVMFKRMVEAAVKGEEIEVPNVPIEWIYSKDAARGTLLALRATIEKDRVFNLSMGPTVSPQQMAAALRSAFPGARTRIGSDTIPGAMLEIAGVDTTRAKKVLGFTPEYPLPEAIRDLAEWLRR